MTPAAAVSDGEWTEERVAAWAEVWAAGAAEAAASTSCTLKGAPAVRTARQVPELGWCGWTGGRSGGPVLTGLVTGTGVTSAVPAGASCVREPVEGAAGSAGEYLEG